MHTLLFAILPTHDASDEDAVEKVLAETMKPYEDYESDEGHNRKGYWDYYSIGGRWAGHLDAGNYAAAFDPANRTKCRTCKGKGYFVNRDATDGGASDICSECEGLKTIPSQRKLGQIWDYGGNNITSVEYALERLNAHDIMPGVLLAPDGKWRKRRKMTRARWKTVLRKAYKQYPEHTLVVVDSHHWIY